MKIESYKTINYGVFIEDFNSLYATDEDITFIKDLIYRQNLVVIKNQSLDEKEFVSLGHKFGTLQEYYEEMYHHKNEKLIFVSSNIQNDYRKQGVPKTGKFWHSDYGFMKKPFAITITYPQVLPQYNRGTYFINMAEVYIQLSESLKEVLKNTRSLHSVLRYFKIRPTDVYKPIGEILDEINNRTPTVNHPTIITHPITGEKILYINEGFTLSIEKMQEYEEELSLPELQTLLELSGQLDKTFKHVNIQLLELEKGDIVLWDNRKLVHHAKHSELNEPTETYRLSVYDDFPFSL